MIKIGVGGALTKTGKNNMLKQVYGDSGGYDIDSYKVGTGTTTPTEADTDVETVIGGVRTIVSGYPIFDTANKKSTARAFIGSGELNGNNISEIAQGDSGWNTILDHHVFTAISKTATDELAILVVIEMT